MKARAACLRAAVSVLLALAGLLTAGQAGAYPGPGSWALVDFTVDGARVEQDVPIEGLERALHQPLAREGESAESIVARHRAILVSYAARHLTAVTLGRDVSPWGTAVVDVTGHESGDGPRALFRFSLRAPHGEASGTVRIHDDLIAHEVISHPIDVYVRSDWATGELAGQPRLAGTIHAGRNDVTVTREGGFARRLPGMVTLGMELIAAGAEQLIFLFALALVAPVAARKGRPAAR